MIHPTPTEIWTFGALQTEALKYKSRSEFGNCNSAAYTIASKTHILDKICNNMESQIKCHNYWAKEKCRERALLYTAKSDFKKYDGSAYTTAVREKWLNEIFSSYLIFQTFHRFFNHYFILK